MENREASILTPLQMQQSIIDYISDGDYVMGREMAKEMVAVYPMLSMSHAMLALTSCLICSYERTLSAALEAVRIWSDNPLGLLMVGEVHFTKGEFEEAEKWLWEADVCFSVKPPIITSEECNSRSVDMLLASSPDILHYANWVQLDLSEIIADRSRKAGDTISPDAMFAMARVDYWLTELNRLIKSLPEDASLYLERAKLYKRMHMYDEFLDDVNMVRKLAPHLEKEVTELLKPDQE